MRIFGRTGLENVVSLFQQGLLDRGLRFRCWHRTAAAQPVGAQVYPVEEELSKGMCSCAQGSLSGDNRRLASQGESPCNTKETTRAITPPVFSSCRGHVHCRPSANCQSQTTRPVMSCCLHHAARPLHAPWCSAKNLSTSSTNAAVPVSMREVKPSGSLKKWTLSSREEDTPIVLKTGRHCRFLPAQ